MQARFLTCLLTAFLLGSGNEAWSQAGLMSPELLRSGGENKLVQTVLFEMPRAFKGVLYVRAYQWRAETDSLLVYEFRTEPQVYAAGPGSRTWTLDHHLPLCRLNPGFESLVRRFGAVPPGQYHLYLSLDSISGPGSCSAVARYSVDSSLALNTPLRNMLNKAFGAGTKAAAAALQDTRPGATGKTGDAASAEASSRKVRRSLRNLKGVDVRTVRRNGVLQSELFCEGWFLGSYKLADTRSMKAAAEEEYNTLKGNAASKVQSGLEDFRSVGSQVRELFGKDEDKKLQGAIDMNFSSATGRDPYSSLDPTYAEIHGVFNTEIKDIPVSLDAYYTTQDAHREARASYFRFQYDAQKAKEKLMKLVSGYRSKFAETAAQGKGLEQVYGQYRDNLKQQAARLLAGAARDYGIDGSLLQGGPISGEALQASLARSIDTAALIREAEAKAMSKAGADSSCAAIRDRYAKARQKLESYQEEIRKRQEQYQALQQKIDKYSAQLEQYRTQVHLDSAMNYARLEKLNGKDFSYKDLAKAAEGLLPEGKVRKAVTGLTHLEGGILDRYESEYTLAGQTVKGLSGGYDIGFATIGGTVGYTEYINRDGRLDRYLGYLGRVDLKEHAGQKFGLVYYGYSPTRQVLRSPYFAGNVDVAYPSFARPVHVLAFTHTGVFGRDLHWQTEAATSLQQGTPQQTIGLENTALKTAAEYTLSKTGLNLKGEWEHLGKDFENRSLPVARAGTERYTAGAGGDFWHDFLHLDVTINYLEQRNLATTGYSTRWGFELRTKSRRYPNVQLAYKPFSTFRAVSDTLAVSQRPLFGEVGIARASYQIKKKGGVTHRFALSYNQNSTTNDTLSYKSVTAQASYLYSDRSWMLGLNGGWMELPTAVPTGYSTGSSVYTSLSAARAFGRVAANAAQDIAVAPFGLQRLSTTAGASYRFVKAPLTLRMTLRYTRYRQDGISSAGNLLAAQLGFGWRFSVPLSDKPDNI